MRRTLLPLLLCLAACAAPAAAPTDAPVSNANSTNTPALSPTPAPTPTPAATQLTPAPTTSVTQTDGPSTVVAFSELYKDNSRPKWDAVNVSIRLATTASALDLRMVEYVSNTLAPLPNVPRLYTTDANADIELHFLPKSRWAEIDMDSPEQDVMRGYTKYEAVAGAMQKAVIVVDESLSQLDRNRTIVHELLHAYGPGHHSCRGAMLYGSTGYDPNWKLQSYDLALMSAWHATDPFAVLQDLSCPPVIWEQVSITSSAKSEEPVWCQLESNECFAVSPSTGPRIDEGPTWWRTQNGVSRYDPSRFVQLNANGAVVLCDIPGSVGAIVACEQDANRSIQNPNWWYDGSVLFDYDPRTHIAFSVDGLRLLCEIPHDGIGPCQFTERATLTGVDMYTDGKNIFKREPGS